MDDTRELLFGKVGEYVRGQLDVPDLYAWLAVRDAEIADPPPQWAEVWELMHEHYAEALPEPSLRAELARILSPTVEAAELPRTQTIAASQFQLVRAFRHAVTVQFRMASA